MSFLKRLKTSLAWRLFRSLTGERPDQAVLRDLPAIMGFKAEEFSRLLIELGKKQTQSENIPDKETDIALIRPGAYGDVLLLSTFLPFLINKYKSVSLFTRKPELLLGFPNLKIEVFQDKTDLSAFGKLFLPIYENGEKYFATEMGLCCGVPEEKIKKRPSLYLNDKELEEAEKILKNLSLEKDAYVILNIESADSNKNWSLSKGKALATKIWQERGMKTLSISEKSLGRDCLHLPVKATNLRQNAALIKYCKALITVDSAPLHIAHALDIPVVGLYCYEPGRVSVALENSIVIAAPIKNKNASIEVEGVFDALQVLNTATLGSG
jgi:ADP-heptose:LPS heptosyltransferase